MDSGPQMTHGPDFGHQWPICLKWNDLIENHQDLPKFE